MTGGDCAAVPSTASAEEGIPARQADLLKHELSAQRLNGQNSFWPEADTSGKYSTGSGHQPPGGICFAIKDGTRAI